MSKLFLLFIILLIALNAQGNEQNNDDKSTDDNIEKPNDEIIEKFNDDKIENSNEDQVEDDDINTDHDSSDSDDEYDNDSDTLDDKTSHSTYIDTRIGETAKKPIAKQSKETRQDTTQLDNRQSKIRNPNLNKTETGYSKEDAKRKDSDENDDVDVTKEEIIDIIKNVDSLVGENFQIKENTNEKEKKELEFSKEENDKTNSKQVKFSKGNSKEINSTLSSKQTSLFDKHLSAQDENKEEKADTTNDDLLSLLETLNIDDDSEIQLVDTLKENSETDTKQHGLKHEIGLTSNKKSDSDLTIKKNNKKRKEKSKKEYNSDMRKIKEKVKETTFKLYKKAERNLEEVPYSEKQEANADEQEQFSDLSQIQMKTSNMAFSKGLVKTSKAVFSNDQETKTIGDDSDDEHVIEKNTGTHQTDNKQIVNTEKKEEDDKKEDKISIQKGRNIKIIKEPDLDEKITVNQEEPADDLEETDVTEQSKSDYGENSNAKKEVNTSPPDGTDDNNSDERHKDKTENKSKPRTGEDMDTSDRETLYSADQNMNVSGNYKTKHLPSKTSEKHRHNKPSTLKGSLFDANKTNTEIESSEEGEIKSEKDRMTFEIEDSMKSKEKETGKSLLNDKSISGFLYSKSHDIDGNVNGEGLKLKTNEKMDEEEITKMQFRERTSEETDDRKHTATVSKLETSEQESRSSGLGDSKLTGKMEKKEKLRRNKTKTLKSEESDESEEIGEKNFKSNSTNLKDKSLSFVDSLHSSFGVNPRKSEKDLTISKEQRTKSSSPLEPLFPKKLHSGQTKSSDSESEGFEVAKTKVREEIGSDLYGRDEAPELIRNGRNQEELNVIDMAMNETVKSRKLLNQLTDGVDDSEDGEVSEIVEPFNFMAEFIDSNNTDSTMAASQIPPTESSSDIPPTTDMISSCSSFPCIHGSCSDVIGGYVCYCEFHYTGVNCDTLIDPCSQSPCPVNAACVPNGFDYTCVCPDGLKGSNCTEVDDPIRCLNVTYKRNIQEDTLINCTRRIQSTHSDLCYDPDDSIVYRYNDTSTNGALYVYESGDDFCLEADPNQVDRPQYCITLVALEEDDEVHRPWRRDSSRVCVIFNEPPRFLPSPWQVTVNIHGAIIGDVITNVTVSDPFVFANTVLRIEEVKPNASRNYFRITPTGIIEFADIPTGITSDGVTSSLLIKVDDGGIPPLTAQKTVNVTLVDIDLVCNFPKEVYFGISSNRTMLENAISCTGASGLTYRIVQSGGFPLMVGVNGAILVLRTPNVQLLPGDYGIRIEVSVGNLASTNVNFTLHADYFEPSCFRTTPVVKIHKSTVPSTSDCFSAFHCNETIYGDVQCADHQLGPLGQALSMHCTVTGSVLSAELCVRQSLSNFNGDFDVVQVINNTYGSVQIGTVINIFNNPPSLPGPLSRTIPENFTIGDVVMIITPQDDFARPLVYLLDAAVPFAVNSTNGELRTTAALDFEQRNSYNLNIQAVDSENLITTGTVNILIENVNEKPVCLYVNGTYIINMDASIPVLAEFGPLNCNDPDGEAVQYEIDLQSSPTILDFFSVGRTSGLLTYKQKLSADLQFTVIVSDANGLTDNVLVKVKFQNYPPTCGVSELQIQILEDSTSCVIISTGCSDPQGGDLTFSKDASVDSAKFNVVRVTNTMLNFCPLENPVGKVGTLQFDVFVDNGFGQLTIGVQIEIKDVNSKPVFTSLGNFTVPEHANIGYVIGSLSAIDNDTDVNFRTFSYSIDEVQSTFMLNSMSGVVQLGKNLNATVQSEYSLRVKVMDNAGLFDTGIIYITVKDENEPPVCENPFALVQGTVDLTSPEGTIVTSLVCWDHDIEDKFKTIIYNITGDNENIFSVDGNGVISVAKPIPRDAKSFRFQVIVADQAMYESGNLTKRTILDVSIAVNTNFPPVCDKVSSNLQVQETKIVGECLEEIVCNDVTLGNVTIQSVSGSGATYMEVKSRVSETQGQLPLNLCVKNDIKNRMGSYQLYVTVSNGLGQTTVTWFIQIVDVNEPPYFRATPYSKTINEYQAISSSVLQIQWADPDLEVNFRTVTVTSNVKEPTNAAEYINFYTSSNTYLIAKTLNATVRNFYWFEVVATDNGGLSTVENVTFFVNDINEAPVCPLTNIGKSISLLTPVGEIIQKLNCYDTDRTADNRNISYTITSPTSEFEISSSGEISVSSTLPRFKNSYLLSVVVADHGNPPLEETVTVSITVNTAISADCTPTVDYPALWLKDACVKINMSCFDPTLSGITHLRFTPSGTYSTAFTLSTESHGVFKLCYNLLTDSNTQLTIIVSNDLSDYRYDLDLKVIYDASTPEFSQSKYTQSISENVTIGSSVLKVNATSGGGGNIVYSIKVVSVASVVDIESDTGLIKTQTSLKPFADRTITLQVEALNQMSQLKSSVDVDIKVEDVNEAPACSLGLPVIPIVRVDSSILTVIQNVTCIDPDINAENKDLDYSITEVSGAGTVLKLIDVTNDGVSIATKELLPVTKDKYDVIITVRDNGQPRKEVIIPFSFNVNLKPPPPVLEVFPVNMTTVRVKWRYEREDFYTVTSKFLLTLNAIEITLPVDKAQTESYIVNLDPDTNYNVQLTAKTNYGDVVTPTTTVRTPAVPVLSTFVASIKSTDENFDQQLLDPQSYRYVTLTEKVIENMNFVLSRTLGYVSSSVSMFRRGSVVIDTIVTVNQTGTVAGVSASLQQSVSSGFLGQMSVDPNYFIAAPGDGYIRITGIIPEGNYYEGSSVKFTCSADVIGNVGTITATWKIRDALINPTSQSRWKTEILPQDVQYPGRRQYRLTIDPLYTADSGNISCHLTDQTLQSSWKIPVSVIGKPVVNISPMTTTLHQGDSIDIECRLVNSYPNVLTSIEWFKNGASFVGSQTEIIDRVDIQSYHILRISNIQSTVRYECMARNTAGTGPRAVSNINVILAGVAYKYCPSDIDDFGTRWNSTIDSTIVAIPCTGEFTGVVTRFCTKEGVWEEPNYSNCQRIELQNVNEQSEGLKNGIEVESVDRLLETLTGLTDANKGDLRSGDLEITSSTLDNVADHAAERTQSISTNQLEEFVNSCNNLLDERNTPSWEQLKKQNLVGISRLVKAVTTYSKAYSTTGDQQFTKTVQKQNIVVQVGKITSDDVIFPDSNQNFPSWISDSSTKVKFNRASISGQNTVGYSGTYYRNISNLFHKYLLSDGDLRSINGTYDVNSVVIDFSINPAPAKLNPPLVVEFEHLSVNYSRPVCGFWDFSAPNTPNGAWSIVGSRTVKSSDTSTTCEYDHMTNFAVLMSPGKTPEKDLLALSIISAVGCGISLLFLVITVLIYLVLWRYLKSDRSTILVNLCVALILSYILFLAGVTQTENQDVCAAMAVLLHYIFLVDFFLMLGEGIEMAFCVLYVFSTRSRVHWLLPFCWIFPAVIVGITMAVTQLEGYGNEQFCWLSTESGVLWAFVGPALLVIGINLIILILVLKTMFSSHSMLTKTAKQQAKVGMRSICVILPLFGVTWVLGVFSVNEDLVVFQYLFAIFNSLQGVFIFLLHCFFNRQVREGFQHSQRRKKSSRLDYSKSTSTHTKNISRESSENIHNNLEEELKKSKNPFLQADNQVQQIVGKFLKSDDGKGNNLNKDNVINIDDIKITNIMREAEINESSPREEEPDTKTSASSADKRASKTSSETKSTYISHKPSSSSSSSRTRLSSTTRSDDRDPRLSQRSDEDFERKSRKDNKYKSRHDSPKQHRKIFETLIFFNEPEAIKQRNCKPGPSHKKGASHWGKGKQSSTSKKHKSHDREKDRHQRRHRHRDRSDVYTVDYYDNPGYPVHHRSMEDMTMQYMGYQQPFVRNYEPVRTPRGYQQPDVPWYEVRPQDYC